MEYSGIALSSMETGPMVFGSPAMATIRIFMRTALRPGSS